MSTVVLVCHVMVAISIVVLVLLQHGKGADMGAAFGSGSAGSLFGASGAANFLSRSTAVCAAIFFVTCLALSYLHAPKAATGVMGGGVMDGVPAKSEPVKTEGGASSIPAPSAPAKSEPAPADSKPQQIPK
jgi:preprotein translocase subunit SecG